MQVQSDVSKLARVVSYLATQLDITGRWIDDPDGKNHIKKVVDCVNEML